MTADNIGKTIFGDDWAFIKKGKHVLEAIEGTMTLLHDGTSDNTPTQTKIDVIEKAIFDKIFYHYGLTREDLSSNSRGGRVTDARMMAAHILREVTHKSNTEISEILHIRDRSTIYFYERRMLGFKYDTALMCLADRMVADVRKEIELWESRRQ